MNEFLQHIAGNLSAGKFLAAFVFSIVGVFLSLLIATTKRDVTSARSPLQFSWAFFLADNVVKMLKSSVTTLLTVFVSLRFVQEFFGVELSMIAAFLIGFCLDSVIEMLRKKKQQGITN